MEEIIKNDSHYFHDGPVRVSNYALEEIMLNTCYNGNEQWIPGSLDWNDIVPSARNDPRVLLTTGYRLCL